MFTPGRARPAQRGVNLPEVIRLDPFDETFVACTAATELSRNSVPLTGTAQTIDNRQTILAKAFQSSR